MSYTDMPEYKRAKESEQSYMVSMNVSFISSIVLCLIFGAVGAPLWPLVLLPGFIFLIGLGSFAAVMHFISVSHKIAMREIEKGNYW